MARSRHARILRHYTAMQLILGMQGSEKNPGDYPNIDYVRKFDVKRRMLSPKEDEAKEFSIHTGLEYMHDLLTLVDETVYEAFNKTLNKPVEVEGVSLSSANLTTCVRNSIAFLHHVTNEAITPMWETPPHPCIFIMREVVADLLAD